MDRALAGRSPYAGTRRRLLIEAWTALVRVRVALWTRGLAGARTVLQSRSSSTPSGTSGEALHDFRIVAWSVRAAARLVPGASCLTQALCAQQLLARRGRSSTVRIGVRQGEAGGGTGTDLRAHAWLLADGHVLLGGAHDLDRHATILELGPNVPSPGERPVPRGPLEPTASGS